MRVAVVGAGVAGLAAAWLLRRSHDVTAFEAAPRPGGHVNTVRLEVEGREVAVDTGFIVHNEDSYPELTRLLAHLRVRTVPTRMGFSVSAMGGRLEYAGTPRGLFAQRRNLARPRFWGLLRDIRRFGAAGGAFLGDPAGGDPTVAEFLEARGFGGWFREHYLMPMAGAIWSAPAARVASFPARPLLGFFARHGLLEPREGKLWRTVAGGARTYVDRLAGDLGPRLELSSPVRAVRREPGADGGVILTLGCGARARFDRVVLACHARAALGLLAEPHGRERDVLGAFAVEANRAVLHGDPALMPRRRAAWAPWNHLAPEPGPAGAEARASVTYWLNRLHGLDVKAPLLLTLNPIREPDPASVLAETTYEHPVPDAGSAVARAHLGAIQGRDRVWFAGAWQGDGFHEDGLASALRVAAAFGVRAPWAGADAARIAAPADPPGRAAAGVAASLPERAAAGPP